MARDGISVRSADGSGPATCVYIPRNVEFTIVGVGEVSVAVCKSPAKKDHKPALIRPEDVKIKAA